MKVYEFIVRVASAYEDIEELLGDDLLAEDLHKAIVKRCQEELHIGKPTDFAVEFGNGGDIIKVYDGTAEDEEGGAE